MLPLSFGSRRSTSGCTPRAMRVQAAHVPQASSSGNVRRISAGVRGRAQTVERLRRREGRQPLPDAGGAGEDQARRQRLPRDRARQQCHELAMSDDVAKGHGRPTPRIVSPLLALSSCRAGPRPGRCRRRATRSRAASSAAPQACAGRRCLGRTAEAAGASTGASPVSSMCGGRRLLTFPVNTAAREPKTPRDA